MVVPPDAESVAETINHVLMMDWDKVSLLIHIFWDICNPERKKP
jgi:hypothetical protein